MTPTRIFLHYLGRLESLLKKAELFDSGIGARRLHPDMFPLLRQAKIAIGFTLRTTCPMAGRQIVSFSDDNNNDDTFESVYAELASTIRYLSAIPDEAFQRTPLTVDTAAGFADLHLAGEEYYLMYAMPNFFFHYAMVYAIARQAGVPIGKADFDGYHKYPLGFIFTDECDPEEAE
jgi:hypothetical protein